MNERPVALALVKAIHTVIWFVVEACMVHVLVSGARGRSDRRVAVAASVVAAETAVFLGNGARCPLTTVAEEMGAESGSVTDIFLPRRFAEILPVLHVPLVGAAIVLHTRNLARRRADQAGRSDAAWRPAR